MKNNLLLIVLTICVFIVIGSGISIFFFDDTSIDILFTGLGLASIFTGTFTLIKELVTKAIDHQLTRISMINEKSLDSPIAFDIYTNYTEFCTKYFKKTIEIIEKMKTESFTTFLLQDSKTLEDLRQTYFLFIPDDVYEELDVFEQALSNLGTKGVNNLRLLYADFLYPDRALDAIHKERENALTDSYNSYNKLLKEKKSEINYNTILAKLKKTTNIQVIQRWQRELFHKNKT